MYLKWAEVLSCVSRGRCHLPGCDMWLKKEQRAPKSSRKVHDLWVEPGDNWVISSSTEGRKSGIGVNMSAEQAVSNGPISMISIVKQIVQEMCACAFVSFRLHVFRFFERRTRKMMEEKDQWENTWNHTSKKAPALLTLWWLAVGNN